MQENEIKLVVKDIDGMQQKLQSLGAELLKKRVLEHDDYFDKDGELKEKDNVLRVRNNKFLTFKGPKQKDVIKRREELEVPIADGEVFIQILKSLGFAVRKQKEKYRTTYTLHNTMVTIDETPMGDYMEIEGSKEDIFKVAGFLGYKEKDFILDSYNKLWKEYKKENNIKGDMLFEK